jgi:hypothetical protein
MVCEFCKQDRGSVSLLNDLKQFECSHCRCKRLGIYDHLSKEELINKLLTAHREMFCLKETIKFQSGVIEDLRSGIFR